MIYNDRDRLICKDCDSYQTGKQTRVEIKNGRQISHCKNCGSDYLVEVKEDVRNEQ